MYVYLLSLDRLNFSKLSTLDYWDFFLKNGHVIIGVIIMEAQIDSRLNCVCVLF